MKQPKRVRIAPGNVDLAFDRPGRHTLTFTEWREGAYLTVVLDLEDWWLQHLAELAGKVARKRIADAESLKESIAQGFHAALTAPAAK